MFVRTFERRRMAKPIPPMPRSNIAQVAGSGTAPPIATGEIVRVPFPKNGLTNSNDPVRKLGLLGSPVNKVGALNWVNPRLAAAMLRLENIPLPKLTVDALPATPPNVPSTSLNPTDPTQ